MATNESAARAKEQPIALEQKLMKILRPLKVKQRHVLLETAAKLVGFEAMCDERAVPTLQTLLEFAEGWRA